MTAATPPTTPASGRVITVTGIDGAGKSTLATRLHQALNNTGHPALLVGKDSTTVPMDEELSAYVERLNTLVYRRTPASPGRAATTTGCWHWPPGTPCRTGSSSAPPSPPGHT